MELSIQERLKDLRVERGLTLEQLAEQTHLSKSALGSYEGDNFKDISHYALIELAKFYEVTVDYLLGRSQTKNHPNADLADLRLSDDMIELLKSGRVDNSLLCELAAHPDFPRLMADLEIYVNGIAGKQVQSANAIVDAVSTTIMKQHNPGLTDPQLRQLMISFSLQACVERNITVRRCKNCGRYFAQTGRVSAEYCDRPPLDGQSSCRAMGAFQQWTLKQADDPVFKVYRREYKRRFAWIKAGRISDSEFYAWSEQAREQKKKCNEGIITAEEFQRWLKES